MTQALSQRSGTSHKNDYALFDDGIKMGNQSKRIDV
jgi:hypothetical protein